jgi:hypothetical protein
MSLEFIKNGNEYVTKDELVSVYQCNDGSWRVAWYPFSDKERNLTKEQAFEIAEERYKEALKCHSGKT